MTPAVTIVIPTFNRSSDVRTLLQALREQSCQDFDVVVVDNSSTDDTASMIAEQQNDVWQSRLKYTIKQPNGPASARNLGARQSDSEFILFMDSDIRPHHEWVERALAHFSANPRLGALSGMVLYAFDPTLVNAYGGDQGGFGLCWDIDEATPKSRIKQSRQVIWANCSALMVRHDLLDRIEGFDERYFYGYEDSELGWKINSSGQELWVFPDLEVLHNVHPDPGNASPQIVFHYCKNRLCSLIKTTDTLGLATRVPLLIGYTVVDALYRSPRLPKLKSIWWNLCQLRETLRQRASLQRQRVVSDKAIYAMGSGRWFPPVPLAGQRRRGVPGLEIPGARDLPETCVDDRI